MVVMVTEDSSPSSTQKALPETFGVGKAEREGPTRYGLYMCVSGKMVVTMGSFGPVTFPEGAAGLGQSLGPLGGATLVGFPSYMLGR
jgi:hypothetical protein